MTTAIVSGRYFIVDTDQVIPSGAAFIRDGVIVNVGPAEAINRKYTADIHLGSDEHLVSPGFVNAHGHGRGITDFQLGTLDDTLENWKFRSYPPIDLYYDIFWRAILLLESGVTTTMHNHNLNNPAEPAAEFATLLAAYRQAGIRVAFAPTLVERNLFVYGDDAGFISSLPPSVRPLAEEYARKTASFGSEQYFAAVDTLRRESSSDRVRIMHGPMSPQWCSDESLQRIKADADRHGMKIHTHLLQTYLQKTYGLKTYGKSLLAHMADIGCLGPNVVCGHCVWLTEDDIGLMAATGTAVTHHPGCNLRIRNGIAPVYELRQKGVKVGIGIDDKGFADSKDFIEEMRLVSKLHRVTSHRLASDHLRPADCFRMGTAEGAAVLGYDDITGALTPGRRADMVLVNLRRIEEPFLFSGHSCLDALIYRGRGSDVDMVLVDGEVVVRGGRYVRHDRQEIISKLRETIPADYSDEFIRRYEQLEGLRHSIINYYTQHDWYSDLAPGNFSPYYGLNSTD